MITWKDLNGYQKAAFWVFIGIAGWFSPEIALLFHFGGVDIVFAFLAAFMIPIISHIRAYIAKLKETLALVCFAYQKSASAKPDVFWLQAVFCAAAFALTGCVALSAFYFIPGLALNTFLT